MLDESDIVDELSKFGLALIEIQGDMPCIDETVAASVEVMNMQS